MTLFLMLNPKQFDISDQFKVYGDIDGGWKKKKHPQEEELPFPPAIDETPEPLLKKELPDLKEKIAEFRESKALSEKLDREMKALERDKFLAEVSEKRRLLELQRQKELQRRREIALEIMKLEEEEALTLLLTMLDD